MEEVPIAFLPGVGASAEFWKPAAELMVRRCDHFFHAWPGLGNEPASRSVNSPDDLVTLVTEQISGSTDLVAQSMGGVIAVRTALRKPESVRRLVLTATSGGIAMDSFGAEDWRPSYRLEFPRAPFWLYSDWGDLSDALAKVTAPVLLLWGDSDPISPINVGIKLQELLPNAELEVIRGGEHDLARTHAKEVAARIDEFLGRGREGSILRQHSL